MRVLLAESDPVAAQFIELRLASEGFIVTTTDDADEASELAKLYAYDAVLLGLELNDGGGMAVLRAMRAAGLATPVLILARKTDPDTIIRALNAGADDCLPKPLHSDELVARLHARIRRANNHSDPVIRCGPLAIDLSGRHASVGGERLHLTPREFLLLELLALRKGAVVTKSAIMDHLYGGRDEPELKIIDVFVCKVRRKLERLGAKEYLGTLWGQGYALTEAPLPANKRLGRERPKRGTTRRDLIARSLELGDKTFNEVYAAIGGRIDTADSIRATLSHMLADGLITNIGHRKMAIYRLAKRAAAA